MPYARRRHRLAVATLAAALAGCGASSSGGDPGPAGPPHILWQDDIQGTSPLLGFDGFGVQHPIDTTVTPADANGANLSRVPNPLPGGGFAMRHLGLFDVGGARSQAGMYGDVNTIFGEQAKRPEGVWVAAELYFPQAVSAPAGGGWLSIWDWHSIDAGTRGNRWHTAPGVMIVGDGSMRIELAWAYDPPLRDLNGPGPTSTISLPVGRWFDLEMHYEWRDSKSATLQVWIDGQLALEQRNVQTRASSHGVVETYMKWYGSTYTSGVWQPSPTVKYTRNVRVAGERIWRDPAAR